jgi:predicted CDP-diglyceride synthetase/phosphatidate cytidylyltransferase
MVAIFFVAMLSGGVGSVILFGLTSFLALREFITMTPTKRGDHDTLIWLFFVITPIQYALVGIALCLSLLLQLHAHTAVLVVYCLLLAWFLPRPRPNPTIL